MVCLLYKAGKRKSNSEVSLTSEPGASPGPASKLNKIKYGRLIKIFN